MSHEEHKSVGPVAAVEKIGPDFGDRTIAQCIEKCLRHYIAGKGNALEANFGFTSNVGDFVVHFHLCVSPDEEGGKGAVKH